MATASRPPYGVVLMALAMLTIPLVDGLAKHLSTRYSPLFLGWARYAAASLIVLPLAARMHGSYMFPRERLISHFLRTLFLIAAMTLYFLSIARIPLATAISTYFVAPIIAVVLSIVVLKEPLTLRKVLSLTLGFAGSMIILRPGSPTDLGILFALGSGVFFAFYLITTRQAAQESDPIKTLVFQCVAGTVLLTPQAIVSWSMPAWNDLFFFAGLGLFSATSHILSITAFRHANASTLAPLVYLELIGSVFLGYLVFHEFPDISTIIGGGLIVLAGLLLFQRHDRQSG